MRTVYIFHERDQTPDRAVGDKLKQQVNVKDKQDTGTFWSDLVILLTLKTITFLNRYSISQLN
jgi:hypothetical protein